MNGISSAVFSSGPQLERMRIMLSNYLRLPFSVDSIPGALMEAVLAEVRNARVLHNYDFIDVVDSERQVAWQVKSTKADTPLTWKRAKIPDSRTLITASDSSDEARQLLGNALVDFCNSHALHSLKTYNLKVIGYGRLILYPDERVLYYEKVLCTAESPRLFDPTEFRWHWSTPRTTSKKEQLPALNGVHTPTGRKWFAWHGRGENQLHFPGERTWWPEDGGEHSKSFLAPSISERITYEQFAELLATLAPPK